MGNVPPAAAAAAVKNQLAQRQVAADLGKQAAAFGKAQRKSAAGGAGVGIHRHVQVQAAAPDARQGGARLHRYARQAGFGLPQRLDFPHRPLAQPAVPQEQFPRQAHAAVPGVGAGRLAGCGPALHPADQDAPAVGGQGRLRGVKIKAVIHRLHLPAVKGVGHRVIAPQQGGSGVAGVQFAVFIGTHLLGADEQHPGIAQGKRVGAFPHFSQAIPAGIQHRDKLPAAGIGAFKQQDAALVLRMAAGRHAVIGAVFPPDLRVTEIRRAEPFGKQPGRDDRVLRVLFKVKAVPHGDALHLGLPAVGAGGLYAGVHQQQAAVGQGRRAAGKTPGRVGVGVRGQGAGQVSPVQQVGAGRVAPVHRPPDRVVGIVLKKQVVGAVIEAEPVGVVHPAHGGRQVKARAVGGGDSGGRAALKRAGGFQLCHVARHGKSPLFPVWMAPFPLPGAAGGRRGGTR